jgi:hypothetical protein
MSWTVRQKAGGWQVVNVDVEMADSGKDVGSGRTEDWHDVNILRTILDEDRAMGQRQRIGRIDNQLSRRLCFDRDEGCCAAQNHF